MAASRPRKSRSPVPLKQLLAGVQVDHQTLYLQPLQQRPQRAGAEIAELHGAQVGEHRHVGGVRLDVEVGKRVRIAQQRADRAHPDGDPGALCGLGQGAIGAAPAPRAAGHARDQQRQPQPRAQEPLPGIDGAVVQFRQRLVQQPHLIEAGAAGRRIGVAPVVDADVEMMLLAPPDRGGRAARRHARAHRAGPANP